MQSLMPVGIIFVVKGEPHIVFTQGLLVQPLLSLGMGTRSKMQSQPLRASSQTEAQ